MEIPIKTYSYSPISSRSGRGHGIHEYVEGRDFAIASDNHIQASVIGRRAARAGTPSHAAGGILESSRLPMRGVNKVRMCGTEIAGKFIKGFPPDDFARRQI